MEDFIKEIDDIIQRDYKEKAIEILNNPCISSMLLNLNNDSIKSVLDKHRLNNISLKLELNNPTVRVHYYYCGVEIEPECYWLRPKNYREPSQLEILQECIKQDTFRPNIKHLEENI